MSVSVSRVSQANSSDAVLVDLFEEIAAKVQAGEPVDLEAYAHEHPEQAEPLRRLLPTIHVLADLGRSAAKGDAFVASVAAPAELERGVLGDFRIFQEIGRGGMGVVYEAEQISLGRRVALKVLPFAAALDSKQLQRFKNEAQAAAHLQHTNIVPVYAVGCERGVHFYAMQFIEGQTLATVIRELRQLAGVDAPTPAAGADQARALASELTSGRWAPFKSSPGGLGPAHGVESTGPYHAATALPHHSPISPPHHVTPAVATLSTERSTKSRGFFRTVAQLALQAAEALEYAHQQGVIHRDIKPANLLVDAGGRLWVTDLGLAHCQSQPGLTMTGDLVGTLRYMSPEQALAKRVTVDARTDVYSLGVTLYELLTLEPAYNGHNREEVLRQIAFEEPRPPSRTNKAVPAELETIVLKAMAKNPEERYATAQELADDLRRHLEDKPIRAKRPSLRQRAVKWARRHKTVVRAALVVLILAVAGLAASAVLIWQANQELLREADRSRRLLYAADMSLAQQASDAGDTGRARALLERHWPEAGQEDLRGFEWRYLWRVCRDGSRQTLRGHTGEVTAVAFSPDGKTLASCGRDHSVRIWDVASQRHTKLLGYQREVGSVAFAPDGKTLAIVQDTSKAVRLWDVAARCERAALPHPSDVAGVAFSPDGKLLATGGSDAVVRLWDVATWREVGALRGHTDGVLRVLFSPDGKTLASAAYYDTAIRLWDVATRSAIAPTLTGHTTRMSSLSFSPDGQTLASSAHETAIRLWNIAAKQEIKTLRAPGTLLAGVAFSPDGKVLATGGGDGTIRVLDAGTGEVVALLRGHTGAITAMAFAPEGRSLVSGSMDGTIKVWDVALRPDTNTLTTGGVCLSVAFSPDGKTLAVGTLHGNHTVKLWDVASRQQVAFPRTQQDQVWCVTFAPGGQILATASRDKTVRLWDVGTHEQLAEFQHLDWVRWADFSPDGKLLAAGYWGAETVLVWDVSNRRKVAEVVGSWVRFSPDGTLLAASSGNTVRFWEVATWENAGALTGDRAKVSCFAFAPDGRTLVTGDVDGALHLWDVARKRRVASCRGHAWHVRSVAFSPDGRRVATSGRDSTVKLWDVVLLQELAALTRHDGPVMGVAFSPDGNTLATAGIDATVRLWEAPPLRTLPPEPADTPSVSPDETIRLFSLEQSGTARARLTSDGNVHRVDVAAVDGTESHAQLCQVIDDLEEGVTYTVRFRAKADAPRRVKLWGQIAQPDWHCIGLDEEVALTEVWQPYHCEFQAKDVTAWTKINFRLGDRTGSVSIADFRLAKGGK